MASLHIRRDNQVVICNRVSRTKNEIGMEYRYKIPRNIDKEFLKCNCLYINMNGRKTINKVTFFTFQRVNTDRLDDGSKFIHSNSGITFVYNNLITIELSKRKHDEDSIHIVLDPTKVDKLRIKRLLKDKTYWYTTLFRWKIRFIILLIDVLYIFLFR